MFGLTVDNHHCMSLDLTLVVVDTGGCRTIFLSPVKHISYLQLRTTYLRRHRPIRQSRGIGCAISTWALFHPKPRTEPNRTEISVFSVFGFGFGPCFLQLRFLASVSVLGAPKNREPCKLNIPAELLVPSSVGVSTPPQHGHIPNPAHIGPTCLHPHPVTQTLTAFATARPQPSAPPDT
jgi:hypothetical protein